MRIFLDDIKKIGWLRDSIMKTTWGSSFLNLPKGAYFVMHYNLKESEGTIVVVAVRIVYEINDGIYRNLQAQNVGYLHEAFESSSYLFYSLMLNACLLTGDESKLEQLFISYKQADLQEAKRNLKEKIIGNQKINSRITFQKAIDNIFKYETKPVGGLLMLFDLIDQYAQKKFGKSFFGNLLTSFVKKVKNPNGGLIQEMAGSTMRYLIVGEKAMKGDPMLEKAKMLLRSGNGARAIYLETGWYYNKLDSKWRKRISDDTFMIKMDKLSNLQGGSVYIPDSWKDNPDRYFEFLSRVLSNSDGFAKEVLAGYEGKLGDFIDFDEAFKLYPDLKDIYGVFAVGLTSTDEYAFYFSQSYPSRIVLISGQVILGMDDIRYTALHEIQHYIQKVEEFANGGNTQVANIITLIGGSNLRKYILSFDAFRNKFNDVATTIPAESYRELAVKLSQKFEEVSNNPSYKGFKIRYDHSNGQSYFIDVTTISKSIINSLSEVLNDNASDMSSSTSLVSSLLLQVYSFMPEMDDLIEDFVKQYVGADYIEVFKMSLEQTKKTIERDTNLQSKGWTAHDLKILNFATYQSLLGEVESRFVQQTSQLPKSLMDYFDFYTSETIDYGKLTVYNDSMVEDDGKNYEAALETYVEDGMNKYIIHLGDVSNTINLLHETGHILADFANEFESAMIVDEEAFCNSFVDYVHRKNIDPMLTEQLDSERSVKNLTEYDELFDKMLYTPSSIDESKLIVMLDLVNRMVEMLKDETYAGGGRIKDSEIEVGKKFVMPNGEMIEIKKSFKENVDEDWVEYERDGTTHVNSVKQLKNFMNNFKAQRFEEGGEISEDGWVETNWEYNSAIPFKCWMKKRGYGHDVILHKKFICLDTEANDGLGSWAEGDAWEFTVKKCYSGRCPDEIKTLEEAKKYALSEAEKFGY